MMPAAMPAVDDHWAGIWLGFQLPSAPVTEPVAPVGNA